MIISILEPLGINSIKLELLEDMFSNLGHELRFFNNRIEKEDVLIQRAQDADVIVVSNIPITANFLDNCPDLSMISVAFTGVDHIDINACNERKIVVSNAANFSTDSVAELTLGMILNVFRAITISDAKIRKGFGRENLLGTELKGKTIGIIGAGAIGKRLAEIVQVFRCRVLAYSRTQKYIEGVDFVSKEVLLRESDVVSLHIPSTPETKNIIAMDELKMMKKKAILINTARGTVVNNQDLAIALKEGIIAGAAIDVYEKEPPLDKDYCLLDAPNLLMLPHIAYATSESFDKRVNIVVDNIKSWIAGKAINVMK